MGLIFLVDLIKNLFNEFLCQFCGIYANQVYIKNEACISSVM